MAETMTMGEWLTLAARALSRVGVASPSMEAQVLAAHAAGLERAMLLAHPERPVPPAVDELLARRLGGEPLAYILGYREFYGRRFAVTPEVLIPRQETETLIDAWFEVEGRFAKDARVLDLGTGSGCIGITLQLEQPNLRVTLADLSAGALSVARQNAVSLGADVQFVESDGFGQLPQRFDAIVTNPPYVADSDPLPKEVRDFEPDKALFAGPSGFEFYRRLAEEGPLHLAEGGLLLTEVGDRQGGSVAEIFKVTGWEVINIWEDLGGMERVLAVGRGGLAGRRFELDRA